MDTTTQFDDVEKIWSGAEVDVDINKNVNLGEFILRKLTDSDPDRVLQVILNIFGWSVSDSSTASANIHIL